MTETSTSAVPLDVPEPLRVLLMHVDDGHPISPDLAIVEHGDYYGVAVVVDGWYAARDMAEGVAPFWAEALADVRSILRASA